MSVQAVADLGYAQNETEANNYLPLIRICASAIYPNAFGNPRHRALCFVRRWRRRPLAVALWVAHANGVEQVVVDAYQLLQEAVTSPDCPANTLLGVGLVPAPRAVTQSRG